MFEAASAFVKNVTEVFGKADGERSKCPRCKGSGLLKGRSGWRWGQPSLSNAPCWFCEGVGVMSIVGVDGYMLGRSNAIVNTREIKERPGMPVNMQLFPAKFPGSKCKLGSYKPSEGTSQLLYDPHSCPAWLHDSEREAVLSSSSTMEAADLRSDPSEFDEMPSWTFMSPEHSGSQNQHRFYARTSGPFSNPTAIAAARLSQPNKTSSTLPAQPSAFLFLGLRNKSRKEGGTPFAASHTLNGLLTEHSWSTADDGYRKASGGLLNSEYSDFEDSSRAASSRRSRSRVRGTNTPQVGQGVTLDTGDGGSSGLEIKDDSKAGKSMVRCSRGHRSPRRPRNRVREEAGKDAGARAQRVQQPLNQKFKEAPSIISDPLVERLLSDDNGEDEYQDLMGVGSKSIKNHKPWPLSPASGKRLSAELSFINKLLYQKAQDIITRTPSLAKG